jgi:hypothetical protein
MSHHFLRGVEDLQGDVQHVTELHKLPANHLPVDDGQGGVHQQAPLQQPWAEAQGAEPEQTSR